MLFRSFSLDDDVIQRLDEAKQINFRRGYTGRIDTPDPSVGQRHIHLYARGKELFSVNKDGSAHDRSHGKPIPKHLHQPLRNLGFKIPPGGLIEDCEEVYSLLIEWTFK